MAALYDFHVHSTASDGLLSPVAVTEAAHAAGIQLFALTDHDTTSGVAAASARGRELGVEVWGGAELSVSEQDGDVQMHILGLGIDPGEPALSAALGARRRLRDERGAEIVRRLKSVGVELEYDRVRTLAGRGVIGRPHIARALVDAGHCPDVNTAFSRWLRRKRPAYVGSGGFGAAEAIDAIHAAGGIASLAHPLLSVGVAASGGLDRFVSRLAELGLDALELQHPTHDPGRRRRIRRACRKYRLLATGGSDFHGDKPDVELGRGRGNVRIGDDVYRQLAERREAIRAR